MFDFYLFFCYVALWNTCNVLLPVILIDDVLLLKDDQLLLIKLLNVTRSLIIIESAGHNVHRNKLSHGFCLEILSNSLIFLLPHILVFLSSSLMFEKWIPVSKCDAIGVRVYLQVYLNSVLLYKSQVWLAWWCKI